MSADPGRDPRPAPRGFGVAASLPPDLVAELAPAAEKAGYRTFWTNDTPQGDGLLALRIAAERTNNVGLGVGLLPLDRWSPARIVARVTELALPTERLILGIGSGGATGGLARVTEAIHTLRRSVDAPIVVGALGPRMCRLAGALADGLLLDWVTPSYAGLAAETAHRAALAAGRPRPGIFAYVFTAIGDDGRRQLLAEVGHYASVKAYAAHFARMDAPPETAAVSAGGRRQARRDLLRFDDALDETIVRAVVGTQERSAYLDLLSAVAPGDGT